MRKHTQLSHATIQTYTHKLLLVVTFLIIYSSLSYAEIRYVSKTGSSTPPYTSWETAADSIQKCINISQFGDTIYVANGVYKEQVVMIPGLSLIGAGMDSCVIDVRGFNNPIAVTVKDSSLLKHFRLIISENIYGRGIRVEGNFSHVFSNQIENAGSYGISCYESNATISHNFINNPSRIFVGKGIRIDFNTPLIDSNFISVNDIGIRISLNGNPTITNNNIFLNENSARGIEGGFNFSAIIRNNNIYAIDADHGIYIISDELVINNNIIGDFDIGLWSARHSLLKNNSITGGETGVRRESDSLQFYYNNVWGNDTDYLNYTPDSTNISYDPMFVNDDSSRGELDFHLQMFSPLIDAGDPNILDKDGSRSDIGAYGGPLGEIYNYLDLAPRAPVNVTAIYDSNAINIQWNKNTEFDFSHYSVYRDTAANFSIDTTRLISVQADTFYTQPTPAGSLNLYYKITAVDSQGNESLPSEEIAVIITSVKDIPAVINNYRLYQNYPNPFNPSTTIGYRLKERGYVKLYVYDVKGELVKTLVNQTQEEGYYEVDFDAEELTSGIYIGQIIVTNERIPVFTEMIKMIYLK